MLRLFILPLFIFISSFAFSQDSISSVDSSRVPVITDQNSQSMVRDQTFNRNTEYILELQRQHRARQKKQAWLYMGMGVLFLAVLVIGLKRRRSAGKKM